MATIVEHKTKKRGRPLRVERDDVLIFVTTRTVEERYWLHPIVSNGLLSTNRATRRKLKRFEAHADKRLLAMVKAANARKGPLQPKLDLESAKRLARGNLGSALARAQKKHGVEVFAIAALSNHLHMVVRTPRKNLAAFMRDFKARLTDTTNRLTGRRGPLWSRRYDAQPIEDDKAVAGRVAYTLDNPTSVNLVDKHDDWPGINLAYGFGDSDRIDFEYLDCTAWHRKKRPANLHPFFRTATLGLSPVPACAGMDRDTYRACVLAWMRKEAKARERSEANKPPLGLDKVIHTACDARPRNSKCSRRPYVFGDRKAVVENYRMMSALQAEHEVCSRRFLAGERMIEFPSGTYPPPIMSAAA